jgi:hypothetical protein
LRQYYYYYCVVATVVVESERERREARDLGLGANPWEEDGLQNTLVSSTFSYPSGGRFDPLDARGVFVLNSSLHI